MSKIISDLNKQFDRDINAFIYDYKNKLVYKDYKTLSVDVDKMVYHLTKKNIKPGEKVLIFAPISYQLTVFMLAAIKLGIPILYVDIWAKKDRLDVALDKFKPRYIAVSKKTKNLKILFPSFKKIKETIFVDEKISDYKKIKLKELDEDTIALLTMTTGSTGSPKIIKRTHRDLYNQLILINKNYPQTDNEQVMTTSYMYVFANLVNGLTTLLPSIKSTYTTKKIEKKLNIYKEIPVSIMVTTPDYCMKIKNNFKDLKFVIIGGAILNYYEAKKIRNHFKNVHVEYIYGATECNLISKISLDDYIKHLVKYKESILGSPANGVNIKVTAKNEILVTSKALLHEYSKENSKKDNNIKKWHKTGDAGRICNNTLYYFGRNDKKVKGVYNSIIEQDLCVTFHNIKKVGVVYHKEELYIFVNYVDRENSEEIREYVRKKYDIRYIKVIKLKKIPCDVKHHTKINYTKLKKLCKKHANRFR